MSRPRVKLLTLHVGKLPGYAEAFRRRLGALAVVDWELLRYPDVERINWRISEWLQADCNKKDGYALSDARPMLAAIFPERVDGYEWWGWVEMDTVLGDLDTLLPPLLDAYDAISCFPKTVSGPLMLLRNAPECNGLFRKGDWRGILREPGYCNFEEVQGAHVAGFHKDQGFTRLLKESGLRTWWDDRFSLRFDKDPAFAIPAGCRLDGNRLLETPTGRELLIYHFNHTKAWPLHEQASDSLGQVAS